MAQRGSTDSVLDAGRAQRDDVFFPLADARAATRGALDTAAVALAVSMVGVFCLITAGILVSAPDRVAPWAIPAMMPMAFAAVIAWRAPERLGSGRIAASAVCVVGSLVSLTHASAASSMQRGDGTASLTLTLATIITVVVGAVLDRWARGAAGAAVGLVVAQGVIHLTAASIDLPRGLDVRPALIAACFIAGFSFAPIARARGNRGVAALKSATRRSRMRQIRDEEGRESIAQLHDTILNQLAVIAHRAPGVLDAHERAGIDASLDSTVLLPLLRHGHQSSDDTLAQWVRAVGDAGGLHIHLEGDLDAMDEVSEPAAAALRAALEQCLVNVVRHANVGEAWVSVLRGVDSVNVNVVDEGVGFAPGQVPADRLGISESVRGRLERVGGSATVWSAEGAGTSVHMRVPRVIP